MINQGKNVAVISDAGMPVISDPGNVLAKKLVEQNIKFTVIPGANAGLTALILSGFDATHFAFFGFLSEKNKELKQQLNKIKAFDGSIIVYSSKYNLNKDLNSLYSAIGNVNVAIVSEITKLHESTEIVCLPYHVDDPKGEYVLIVENKIPELSKPDDVEILSELKTLIKNHDKQQAFKIIKEKYGLTKSYVYNLYEKNKTL